MSDTSVRPWPATDLSAAGLCVLDAAAPEGDQINQALSQVAVTARGESYLMWCRYMRAGDVLDLLLGQFSDAAAEHEEHRLLDPRTQAASTIRGRRENAAPTLRSRCCVARRSCVSAAARTAPRPTPSI